VVIVSAAVAVMVVVLAVASGSSMRTMLFMAAVPAMGLMTLVPAMRIMLSTAAILRVAAVPTVLAAATVFAMSPVRVLLASAVLGVVVMVALARARIVLRMPGLQRLGLASRQRERPFLDLHSVRSESEVRRQRLGQRHGNRDGDEDSLDHPWRVGRLEAQRGWIYAEHGPGLLVRDDESRCERRHDHSSAPSRHA
jgi:hypothetical protein